MPTFPWITTSPVVVYDIVQSTGDKPDGLITLEAIRQSLAPRLFKGRAPTEEQQHSTQKDQWGWCYLDDVGPVVADRYVLWGVRHFRKSPPGPLMAALTKERVNAFESQNEGERCPSGKRKDIAEAVRVEIASRTPPTIVEHPILIDTRAWRLILFTTSESVLDEQSGAVKQVLQQALPGDQHLSMRRWDFMSYLRDSRGPSAVLPAACEERFMHWLCTSAYHERWYRLSRVDELDEEVGATEAVWAALGEDIQTSRNGDRYRVEGEHGVEEFVEAGLDSEVSVQYLEITIRDRSRTYYVRINPLGHLRKVILRTEGLAEYSMATDGDWESALVDRADDFVNAYDVLRKLWAVWDHTELTRLMQEEAQVVLWPSTAPVTLRVEQIDLDEVVTLLVKPEPKTPIEEHIEQAKGDGDGDGDGDNDGDNDGLPPEVDSKKPKLTAHRGGRPRGRKR